MTILLHIVVNATQEYFHLLLSSYRCSQELENYRKYDQFKAGSMLPKVEATIKFAKKGGIGIITDIEHLKEALQGKAGTIIKK